MSRLIDWYGRLSTFGRWFTAVFVLHMLGLVIAAGVAVPTLHALFWLYVAILGGCFAAAMSLWLAAGIVAVFAFASAFEVPYRWTIGWLGTAGVLLGWLLALGMVPYMGLIGMIGTFVFFFAYLGPALGAVAGLIVGAGLHGYQRLRKRPRSAPAPT